MKRLRILTLGVALLALPALAACGSDDDDDDLATATNTTASQTTSTASPSATEEGPHLENATVTPSGLEYVDEVVGTGDTPTMNDQVAVHYTGRFAETGEVFESTDGGQPASFAMTGVIRGFSEALSTMKVGGKRTVYVPSELGYGEMGFPPVIPPNTDLIFELELVAIK